MLTLLAIYYYDWTQVLQKDRNTECPFLTLQPPTPPDSRLGRFTLSKMKYTYPFQKTDHSGQIQLIKQLLIVSNTETDR